MEFRGHEFAAIEEATNQSTPRNVSTAGPIIISANYRGIELVTSVRTRVTHATVGPHASSLVARLFFVKVTDVPVDRVL